MMAQYETCQERTLILICNTALKLSITIKISSTQEKVSQKNLYGCSGHLNKRFRNIEMNWTAVCFGQILF